jgi:hypothetical protein
MGGEPAVSRTPPPRWLVPVAGAVVVLAVAIGVIAGLTLNGTRSAGSGSAAAAAAYVPADATFYYELRLDLPGDQRANLRAFLGHFPGVDAERYLTDQVDQQLDDLTSKVPAGFSYTKDVKPWFNGTLAFAMLGYPSMAGIGANSTPAVPQMLIFAGVKDATGAAALGDRLRTEITRAGGTVSTTSHGSATIWSSTATDAVGGTSSTSSAQLVAWTITSDVIIAGTGVDLVASALDAHAGSKPSLANRQEFRDGLARLPADRVFTMSLDSAPMFAQLQKDLASLQPGMKDALSALSKMLPTFQVGGSRFLADRLTFDSNASMPSGALPANRDRGLAALAPGDAILFDDGADVGKGLTAYLDAVKAAVAGSGTGTDELRQVEGILGGDLSSMVSWIGDAALVAGVTDKQPYFGVIITPTNANDARTRLAQLRGLLDLAAGTGTDVTVSDADHNGTKITTIKVHAGTGTPAWATTYQYAVTDQRVVIGSGETLVARVLDTQQADSLAGQQRFASGVEGVGGASNIGTLWVDLTALRTAVEPMIPADAAATYRTELQPWLTPFDYIAGTNRADGQQLSSRFAIVLK